jgi:translation initiation factor IF-3
VGFRRRRWRDLRPEEDKTRVNEMIRVLEVRVINDEGQQLGVMSTDAARDIASRVGLDLVEIAPSASPPVCKIMDYGRFKYEAKKKASSAKKSQHQQQVKEIKLRPRIADHDLDFKLRNARSFLVEGDKVKWTVIFRGREMLHTQLGRELLQRVAAELGELAHVEAQPIMEGRMLHLTVGPNKAAIERWKAENAKQLEELTRRTEDADDAVDDDAEEAEAEAETAKE